jgi:hypothetical protein
MEARPPAGPDQPAGMPRASRSAASRSPDPLAPGVERRLAALEMRLDDLDEAVREVLPEAIRQVVEAACREAVADEMQQVSENLRRSVSEFGRLLLRDLDRLTKLLADHRDAIVERLSEPPPVETFTDTGEEDEEVYVFEPPDEPDGHPDPAGADAPGPPPTALVGEEGRWRVLPGRRKGRPRGRHDGHGKQGGA